MSGTALGVEPKKIHPFFTASKTAAKDAIANAVRLVTPESSCSAKSDRASEKLDPADATDECDAEHGNRRRKRPKTDSSAQPKEAPAKKPRKKRQSKAPADKDITSHFGQNQDTTALGSEDGDMEDMGNAASVDGRALLQPLTSVQPPVLNAEGSTIIGPGSGKPQDLDSGVKPAKMLKFNPKTGTFGSPPKPKVEPTATDEQTDVSKSKSTRTRRTKKPNTCIACISYGTDDESRNRVAERVEEILSGVCANTPEPNTATTSKPQTISSNAQQGAEKIEKKKDSTHKKPTHPFFTGRPKVNTSCSSVESKDLPKSPVKRHRVFTSTPCSPKQVRSGPAHVNVPQFGLKTGGLKVPGAQYPPWPWKGIVHVRGEGLDEKPPRINSRAELCLKGRKSKGQQTNILEQDSILRLVADSLRMDKVIEELRARDPDDFQPAPSIVRIPNRYFESGKQLQRRVSPELRTYCRGFEAKTHPAVVRAYKSIAASLSAFDQSTCENTTWAQKYAPVTADQVLQAGREAELLRDWLETLKVQSVHTGVSDNPGSKSKQLAKRKRGRKKLDGFVVSSDEEEEFMDEVSESEEDNVRNGSQGGTKKTVIRAGDMKRSAKDSGRLTNGVLLSGPHGCGKTATVYAIAKELDFEIFEIGPGSRRNGQDIVEKIGDMTRNHLVQHQQNGSGVDADAEVPDDEVARDLKSGKQGMMTAFFKPKANLKPKLAKKPGRPSVQSAQTTAEKQPSKASSKAQKQSLILLEEVDILFKEDKQFWATVISLMAQSKRPFIMTCNDESLAPLENLTLHGIFRFNPPPRDAAVDLLLLISANEGHALKRNAVESLFESRQHDLRASIMELNYWCQVGVGDVKGGFDWILPRWPKNRDLDDKGNKIRVVSSDTYQAGMGWFGRDAIVTPSMCNTVEEEIVQQSWGNWNLDTSALHMSSDQAAWAEHASKPFLSRKKRLATLEVTDAFSDLMSVVDICSGGAYSVHNQVAIDATLPDLPPKSRDDFIIGRQLIDAPLAMQYQNTCLQITSNLRTLAYSKLVQSDFKTTANPLDESMAMDKIHDSFQNPPYTIPSVTRMDYSLAFDPIAASEKQLAQASGHLDPSVFDRTMVMLTLDVAPYVRSIVAYDQHLQEERRRRSNLLSEGGKTKKRMRTTRSAHSALEGGSRASTRRERYFTADINPHLVMQTGGKDWGKLATVALGMEALSLSSSAQQSNSEVEMDVSSD